MEGIYVGKGIVIGTKSTSGLLGCKTMGNCVYNETAEKQGSFSSFIAWNITCKLMRWKFLGSDDCVVSGSDTSCYSASDYVCDLLCWWLRLDWNLWTQYIPWEMLYLHWLRTNTRCVRNLWCLAMMQSIHIHQNDEVQI